MRLADLNNLAGFVTLLRLPLAVAAPFLPPAWLFAAYLFGLLTDVLDGPIARRTGTTSAAGAALDGWLDKVLHVNVGWTLAVRDVVPDWFMLCWFSRELIQGPLVPVLIHRFRTQKGEAPRTSPWGRATAILLAVAFAMAMAGVDATVPTVLSGVTGTVAGLHYAVRHLRRRETPDPG